MALSSGALSETDRQGYVWRSVSMDGEYDRMFNVLIYKPVLISQHKQRPNTIL